MKTLTFFNEKGGVGKSLHTIMYASWLQYSVGAKVAVFDLESPTSRLDLIRRQELSQMEDPESVLARYLRRNPCHREPYDIFTKSGIIRNFTRESLYALHNELWDFIRKNPGGYDYVLFDFPGLLTTESPAYDVIASGMVDLVVIPVDTDNITRKSALLTARMAVDNEQKAVVFWNNVTPGEMSRPGYLDSGERLFTDRGIPFLRNRIRSFQKARRDSDERLFVRSTVCWPAKYVEMACPAVVPLYEEIRGLIG